VSSRLSVVVVGAGYWGPNLARNFRASPDWDLAAICDLDLERAQRVADAVGGVRVTSSLDDVLADPTVDAIAIATPARTHHPIAMAALEAGKHVIVEKPLADESARGIEMVERAHERGLVLMTDHTFCYTPAVLKIRELIADGYLGDILFIDSVRINLGLIQPDVDVFWDLAPHDLSILLYVLGCEPQEVSARGTSSVRPGIHDVAYVELRFPNNILAHLHLSWLDPCKVRRITIVGSKKMVVCNDLSDSEKVRIYDKGVDQPYETDQFKDFHLQYRYGTVTIPWIPFREPLRVQCEHFIECAKTGQTPQSDGTVGTRVVRILELADKSLQNGGGLQHVPMDMVIDTPAVFLQPVAD